MAVDKFGKEIVVGSYIVYPYMHGYWVGKVTAVKSKVHPWKDGETAYPLTVIGIDDNYGPPKLLSKKSTLQFADRVVVLNPEQIPAEYKVLLDNYQ
jgi:hypothetical protein